MKPMKTFLRWWFAITSVFSFAAGWVILAHSPKPVSNTSTSSSGSSNTAPMPTLPPLNLNGSSNNNNNNSNPFSGLFNSAPSTNLQPGFGFRTGGS